MEFPIQRLAIATATAILALTCAIAPARANAASPVSRPESQITATDDKIVTMEKFEVYATRFNWTRWMHARTAHFEIISNLQDTQFVASVVTKAERIITLFENATPLFSPQRDLPAKLIFVEDEMAGRLFPLARVGATQDDFDERMAGAPFRKPVMQFKNPYKISALANYNDGQLVIVKLLTDSYMSDDKPEREHPGLIISQSGNQFKNEKSLACAADLVVTYLNACVRIHTGGKKVPWLAAALNAMRGHVGGDGSYFTNPPATYEEFDSKVYGKIFRGPKEWLKKDGRPFPIPAGSNRTNSGTVLDHHTFYDAAWIDMDGDTLTLGRYCLLCEIDCVKSARDFPKTPIKQKELWAKFMLSPGAISLGDIFNGAYFPLAGEVQPMQRQFAMQREDRDFMYYCLFGPDPAARAAFTQLVLASAGGQPVDEPLFQKIFGSSYAEMQDAMYAHYQKKSEDGPLANNPWGATDFVTRLEPGEPVVLQSARRADTTRIISDWFDVCDAGARARALLLKAIDESPQVAQDPQFLATLGLNEARYGDPQKATTLLEKAADAKITNPRVYRTLTNLYLENILKQKGAGYRLTADELRNVLAPLAIAFEQPTPDPQNYVTYAAVCDHTDIEPTVTYENLILEACQKFPDDIDLLETILPSFAKRGYKDEALQLARDSAQLPLPPEKKQRLDKLVEKLEAK